MYSKLGIFLGLFQTFLSVIQLTDPNLWVLLFIAVVSSIVAWKV